MKSLPNIESFVVRNDDGHEVAWSLYNSALQYQSETNGVIYRMAAVEEITPAELIMGKTQTPEELLTQMVELLDKLFADPNMGELLVRFHNNSRHIRFTKYGRFFYSSNTGKIGP